MDSTRSKSTREVLCLVMVMILLTKPAAQVVVAIDGQAPIRFLALGLDLELVKL